MPELESKLRAALGALEQVNAGMIGGRVASAEELDSYRRSAVEAVHGEIDAAIGSGAAGAKALLDTIPPWARSLLDPSRLANLEGVAAKYRPATPARVVHLPFGAFSWEEGIAGYVSERPLSVGELFVSLSLADAGAEDVAERLCRYAWLQSRVEEVIEAGRRFAAKEGLELHNQGYADPDEGRLTEPEFRRRLTPTHLDLEADGVEIHFDDGGLFWGHWLIVSCDEAGIPSDLSMAG